MELNQLFQDEMRAMMDKYVDQFIDPHTLHSIEHEANEILLRCGPIVLDGAELESLSVRDDPDDMNVVMLEPKWRLLCPALSGTRKAASISTPFRYVRGLRPLPR